MEYSIIYLNHCPIYLYILPILCYLNWCVIFLYGCEFLKDDDGKGHPEFTGETDCTYFFSWQTKYACIGEKEDLPCMVADKKKRYDLTRLIRHSGMDNLKFCY